MTRREFLEAAVALTVSGTAQAAGSAGAQSTRAIPRRRLGTTGVEVSILGLGGAHIGIQKTEQESIGLIRRAVDGGITFLDNCWDYHLGQSELRMGKALRDGYREQAFLMTKIDGRDQKTAAQQIDESLRRLQTDRLDLLQLHEVIRPDDPSRAFGPGGAIEAMVAARKAGKARFLGFTGHKSPDYHLKMLETARAQGFRFDTVQMPLNVLDAHFESFEQKVLPVLVREKIGVLGMKPMGDRFILDAKAATAPECLRYALSLPTSVVITGIDSQPILDQALAVGRGFQPFSEEEIRPLLAKTAATAKDGANEKYKTSHHFDGTWQHPEWLGP
ncbi:MAG TPA: aldo/keto reductase [Myxococcales bacterium]|jgi:aryl-alcohol dehydrogenase-like predicted oxidoreductase